MLSSADIEDAIQMYARHVTTTVFTCDWLNSDISSRSLLSLGCGREIQPLIGSSRSLSWAWFTRQKAPKPRYVLPGNFASWNFMVTKTPSTKVVMYLSLWHHWGHRSMCTTTRRWTSSCLGFSGILNWDDSAGLLTTNSTSSTSPSFHFRWLPSVINAKVCIQWPTIGWKVVLAWNMTVIHCLVGGLQKTQYLVVTRVDVTTDHVVVNTETNVCAVHKILKSLT